MKWLVNFNKLLNQGSLKSLQIILRETWRDAALKLLFCTKCSSVFSLDFEIRACHCGSVNGRYVDDVTAIYSGVDAVPIGFSNTSFFRAIIDQPTEGLGLEFTAFVIPKDCSTFLEQSFVPEPNQKTNEQLAEYLKRKISEIESTLEHRSNDQFLLGRLSGLKNAYSLIGIFFNSRRASHPINIEIDTPLYEDTALKKNEP